MSSLPKSRWLNLNKLDALRQRNRAADMVKTSKAAPFFLATVPGSF